jgi:hypothetical protein
VHLLPGDRPVGSGGEDEVALLDVGDLHVLGRRCERETAHGRRDVVHSEPAEITGDVDLDVTDLGHGDGGQGEENRIKDFFMTSLLGQGRGKGWRERSKRSSGHTSPGSL